MKKILLRSILIIFLGALCPLSFVFSQNISNVPTDATKYSQNLALLLGNGSKPQTMKDVIYDYCNGVLSLSAAGSNITGDNYYYSAKDSIFLYILCHNINPDFDRFFDKKFTVEAGGYFQVNTFTGLGIVDYSQDPDFDYCSPQSSLQYCDLSYHLPRVFNMIINDLFSVQQSRVYGLTSPDFDERDIESQIDDYASNKFNIKFCDDTEGKYPSLCKAMKTYQKSAAKLLKDLDIINYDSLYLAGIKDPVQLFNACQKTNGTYKFDHLLCGLFGYGFTINPMYVNLIYNEFLHYSMFVQYYNYVIVDNNNLAPLNQRTDSARALSYLQNNVYAFNRQVNASQKAIALSMKMLREIDVTFPLHVGFMMYQEDLLNLRDKSLYKIVTPFYTLYNKLRNVQTKDK